MIVDIDHLAFATDRLKVDKDTFLEVGYKTEFAENGLKDLENKRPLMEHFSGHLDMALLKHSSGLSVELINHGHNVNDSCYLHPIFEGITHEVEKLDDTFVADDNTFIKVWSKKLRAAFFTPKEPSLTAFKCNTIIVDAQDIKQSAAFWQHIGFKPVSVQEEFIQLSFRSILGGGNCKMYVRKKQVRQKKTFLDARGFNCIAFFSSNAEKDRLKFKKLGIKATETNYFQIGGKDLVIHWLEGPGGEIVEIIGRA